jgi:predicted hotdog family 3-hydroxylacyl-ACP dehydratase
MIQSLPDTFPPIEDLLPHRGTMLLLELVAAFTDDALTAHARVDGTAWYADANGGMPAWLGIELMAQAIAAHVGLMTMRTGKPMRPGVLLGSQRYSMQAPSFARDARLRIDIRELLRGEEGHGAYECVIHHDDAQVAEAVIKVFQPRDFQSFIEEGFRS